MTPPLSRKKITFEALRWKSFYPTNKSFRNKVLLPKGEPENPATIEELEEKFRSCIGNFWNEQKKEDVIRAIRDLEQLDDIRMLTELLSASIRN